MKKKLIFDELQKESSDDSEFIYNTDIDYSPKFFLRCHSRSNNEADVQTQVWQCAFEPDIDRPNKTTNIVATCGGVSVCLIDVTSGKCKKKFSTEDQKEMLYTLCWTTVVDYSGDGPMNLLATGGAKGQIHVIHPDSNSHFLGNRLGRFTSSRNYISCLLFHPKIPTLLFCSTSFGNVYIFDLKNPFPPFSDCALDKFIEIDTNNEIFNLSYSVSEEILIASCNKGLIGWKIPSTGSEIKKRPSDILFHLPTNPQEKYLNTNSNESRLVDSIHVLHNGLMATKCALHGCIYIWNLKDTLNQKSKDVVPDCVLKWSDTDNYFMNIGFAPGCNLLGCGDDKGNIWLYDLTSLSNQCIRTMEPTCIISWPEVTDPFCSKARKLRMEVYDIVLDKVSFSSEAKYMVSVTNNNLVCIWEKC